MNFSTTYRRLSRRMLRPQHLSLQPLICGVLVFAMWVGSTHAADRSLILFAGTHTDPSYIVSHIDLVESGPFDGIVINEYLGRNLLNSRLADDAPAVLSKDTGAITAEAAEKQLRGLRGVFKRFKNNFVKVNFNQVGYPPLLDDDAGWAKVYESAEHYSRAVASANLTGIFFDDETYRRPQTDWNPRGVDYWQFEDQVRLQGKRTTNVALDDFIAIARQRGREFMSALARGYPKITIIVAHGPYIGCDSWHTVTGGSAQNQNLAGAFTAGMVEGAGSEVTFVDGGEDYDLRSKHEFEQAYAFRKGEDGASPNILHIGTGQCPFMSEELADMWRSRVTIAFSTFDKERSSRRTNDWTPISNVAQFEATLTNALKTTDRYVWHYCQWQDWLGDTSKTSLEPWKAAIKRARASAGLRTDP